ncbi:stage V sporulation protein B [Paenibacillus eucommiae]|uniref:Stage V sporulation protein B n=1 Tax=Paenibacillus eucommiae TaxID=1355755 RepID=A0ABS4JA93_9BACL|nr:stage V sporulation protein B [Paenibacillus eucommiae]MBP1996762.1 stage V sporulation protein B [Paenibacillus eucommiae]
MSKQSFIKGTLILLAAGVMNRILGFIPRITLPRVIGAEGVGLYQMGWPFLIVILTFLTGGIPIAIAKLVAEAEAERNESRSRSILKISLTLSVSMGIVFTLICLLASKWITTHLLTDSRVYLTFICMSPIIIMVAVSSVLRGYFQGKQNMIPTAVSQIVETLVRIVMVLVFAYMMLPYGIEFAAAGAMIGVMAGEFCGMLMLLLHYRSSKRQTRPLAKVSIGTSKTGGRLSNLRRILRISIPVTASKLIGAGSYLLESILITQSLAIAGISTAVATAQYGALQGMIIPILLLPSALTFSLSVSLVPSLSEAAARKDMVTVHQRLHQSLRLALITGAPFAVLMYVLAEPICKYMYNQPDIGIMLKMMAPVALFIYFQAPLQAALQALDKPGSALVNTLIGACVKLILIYWLASKPDIGILGAVLAINVNIVLITLLHWRSIVRLLNFRMQITDFFKVLVAMVISGISCYLTMYMNWSGIPLLRFLSACLVGGVVYVLFIWLMRLILPSDVSRLINLGKKIIRP